MFSVILALIIIALGIWQYFYHEGMRKGLKIVIDVNGSRGKSSVTRLIAGALREAGIPTVAKVTGTTPYLIGTEGEDHLIVRPDGHPNIIEQLRIVELAHRQKAQAIVSECMALIPHNQKVEQQMIRPNIAVITNVRPDHMDVMGPAMEDVACALSGTISKRGVFITAEQEGKMLNLLKLAAKKYNRPVAVASGKNITDDMMKPFPYLEHRENVALVLEVCRYLDISDEVALQGMYKALPDPGVLKTYMYKCGHKNIEFINAMAANDPESLHKIWKRMAVRYTKHHTRITLVNSRKDRMHRSLQLTRFVHDELSMDYLVLVGDYTHLIKYRLWFLGISPKKIINLSHKDADTVIEKIVELTQGDAAVFAIGNIGGIGKEIIDGISTKCEVKWSKPLSE